MSLTLLIFILVATAGTAALWRFGRGRRSAGAAERQVRRIRIDGTYQPAEVHVRAGAPTRLIFRREETAACSEHVVFPDHGISVMLPPFEDVAIDLPASAPGQHPFTCDVQMLRGVLVVDEANASPLANAPIEGAT